MVQRRRITRPIILPVLAVLMIVLVGGGPLAASAQGVVDEPQAWVVPGAAALSVEAGGDASTTLTLINDGDTPLEFAWRGETGAPALPLRTTGYGWMDSTEPRGPAFTWLDVAPDGVGVDGARLSFQGDDGVVVDLPFPFAFYGVIYRSVTVSPNGYLTFGGDGAAIADIPLPSRTAPRALIAPFWGNLAPELLGSVATYHDADARRFIIQYTDVARGPRSFQERATFQVILHADGTIHFQYGAVTGAERVTIGIQNDLRTDGVVLAHNAPYAEEGLAVAWYPRPAYLAVQPAAGTVAPSERATLTLSVRADGVAPGVYRSRLVLGTSDPQRPAIPVHARVDVGQEASPFQVTPERIERPLRRGETTTVPLSITNQDAESAQAFRIQVQRPLPSAATASKSATDDQDDLRPRDPTGRRPVGRSATPGAIGYSSNVLGAGGFVSLDLAQPGVLAELAPSPISFAGDFPFGTDRWFYILTDESHLLQQVDVETGQRTTVGQAVPGDPRERWSGMAIDPTNGTLFASTTIDGGTSYLYEVDPRTATAVRTAQLGNASVVTALAIDGGGQLYGIETREDQLLRIDKRTGEVSIAGSLGFDANFDQGLDVDLSTGTMYLTALEEGVRAQLRRVDPTTGRARVVAPLTTGVHLGYLALPSGAFVQAEIREGVVPPGSTVTVETTLRAADLVAGTYEAEVHVEAPDRAGVPAVTVPVRLSVLGDPRINVLFRELSFGQVFVGGTSVLPLLVQNTGNDVLEISRFQVEGAAFSVVNADALPLRLSPGSIRTMQVRFRPQQEGPVEAQLQIESSDPARPSVTVPLHGEGVRGPELSVTPEQLHLEVVDGQRLTQQFTVRNGGARPLEYDLRIEDDGFDAALPPVLREGFDRRLPPAWLVVDRASTDVVWQLHNRYAGESNYTGGVGLAAMVSSSAAPGIPFDTELWSPAMEATSSQLELVFKANFITQAGSNTRLDLDLSTDDGSTWATLRRWTDDLGGLFGPGTTIQVDLAPHIEAGDTFRLRWRYHTTEAAPTDFYVQVDDIEVHPTTDVLSVARTEGTVPPGGKQTVPVVVDADGVRAGQYEAHFIFTSNDPSSPVRTVPMTLEVVNGLRGSTSDYSLSPNGLIAVPLMLAGRTLADVHSYRLALDYDADLLRLRTVSVRRTISEGATVSVDSTQAGRVQVAAEDLGIDGTGQPRPLVILEFQARERLGASPLTWTELSLNDGALPASTADGAVTVEPLYGDATLNLLITHSDATLVSRAAVGSVRLSEAARAAADVSGNGRVDVRDAHLIREFVEGGITCFPVEAGCTVSASMGAVEEHATALHPGADGAAPQEYHLGPNYPNPSNPSTLITYALPERSHTRLTIYNALGQPVRTLVNREQGAGQHRARWDGRAESGQPAASGVYFYRLEAGGFVQTRQLTLVR